MALSRLSRRTGAFAKIPRAYTVTETACLLDLAPSAVHQRIRSGKLAAYIDTYWNHPPGKQPWRRRRLYITAAAIVKYQELREQEYERARERAMPRDPDGLRRYWRAAQARSRARRRDAQALALTTTEEAARRSRARPDEAAERVNDI